MGPCRGWSRPVQLLHFCVASGNSGAVHITIVVAQCDLVLEIAGAFVDAVSAELGRPPPLGRPPVKKK
jgi:hypothetical protein